MNGDQVHKIRMMVQSGLENSDIANTSKTEEMHCEICEINKKLDNITNILDQLFIKGINIKQISDTDSSSEIIKPKAKVKRARKKKEFIPSIDKNSVKSNINSESTTRVVSDVDMEDIKLDGFMYNENNSE